MTTIYWSGTEEQQHRELAKACKSRCKQYGKADCPRPDVWCDECEHDQAVAMRTTDPAEIAAIESGDL